MLKKLIFSILFTILIFSSTEILLRAFKFTRGLSRSTKNILLSKQVASKIPTFTQELNAYETNILPYMVSFKENKMRTTNILRHLPDRSLVLEDYKEPDVFFLGSELTFGRYLNDWETIPFFYYYLNFLNQKHLYVLNGASIETPLKEQFNKIAHLNLKNKLVFIGLDSHYGSSSHLEEISSFYKTLIFMSNFALFKIFIDPYFSSFPKQSIKPSPFSTDELTVVIDEVQKAHGKPIVFFNPYSDELNNLTKVENALQKSQIPFINLKENLKKYPVDDIYSLPEAPHYTRYGALKVTEILLKL